MSAEWEGREGCGDISTTMLCVCVCVCLRVLTCLSHCCSVCKADQHVLSADGPGGAQYLTIEVGGALSQGVGHCLRGWGTVSLGCVVQV